MVIIVSSDWFLLFQISAKKPALLEVRIFLPSVLGRYLSHNLQFFKVSFFLCKAGLTKESEWCMEQTAHPWTIQPHY
jgi:hypothetical protein